MNSRANYARLRLNGSFCSILRHFWNSGKSFRNLPLGVRERYHRIIGANPLSSTQSKTDRIATLYISSGSCTMPLPYPQGSHSSNWALT